MKASVGRSKAFPVFKSFQNFLAEKNHRLTIQPEQGEKLKESPEITLLRDLFSLLEIDFGRIIFLEFPKLEKNLCHRNLLK
jgi:hypothetical protein